MIVFFIQKAVERNIIESIELKMRELLPIVIVCIAQSTNIVEERSKTNEQYGERVVQQHRLR